MVFGAGGSVNDSTIAAGDVDQSRTTNIRFGAAAAAVVFALIALGGSAGGTFYYANQPGGRLFSSRVPATLPTSSSGESSSGSDITSPDITADQVWALASAAMKSLKSWSSYTVSHDANGVLEEDATTADSTSARTYLTLSNGLHPQVLAVGGKVYGESESTSGKWFVGTPSSTCYEESIAFGSLYPHGQLTKRPVTSVAGRAVLEIYDNGDAPGDAPGEWYIAAHGTPYILREVLTGPASPGGPNNACGGNGGSNDFDPASSVTDLNGFDQPVEPPIVAPADAISSPPP